MRASFLPGPRTTVAERIDELKLHEIDLGDGAVLETGCVYIVPLLESLALPPDIAAAANPKSSTGRLDVFTRVIADETRGFDRIEAGYHGPLYAEISPRTFPVLVREGSRLSQIRFRRGHALLDARRTGRPACARAPGRRRRRGRRRRHSVGVDLARRGPQRPGRLSRQAPHRPDRRRAPRRLRRSAISGSRCAARAGRHADPRPRRVLHPRLQGGRAGAARLRRRDGAVRSAGRRVPRALCRLLRSRLRLCGRRRPRRRAVLEVRSREVPFILEHGQTSAASSTRRCWRGPTRSTARASARTTRRRA